MLGEGIVSEAKLSELGLWNGTAEENIYCHTSELIEFSGSNATGRHLQLPSVHAMPASQADVDAVRSLLQLADREVVYNDAIMAIIIEEAGAFNSGDMTVEKAAENINRRVQLYLDEQR